MDGRKKTYSSLLAGEPSNDEWYTLLPVWQVLFYWGQPNKTFTLLSLVFQSTLPLFECEMATQMLLNHRGGFAHASVYKIKSEVLFICWCSLLPFTSTHLPLPLATHQDTPAAAAGDDGWAESCWELCQQQERGKQRWWLQLWGWDSTAMCCSHWLCSAHPGSADSRPHFPQEGMKKAPSC